LEEGCGISAVFVKFNKETLPSRLFGLLVAECPHIFKEKNQIWHFGFAGLDFSVWFEMLGDILVQSRLQMATYRRYVLLVSLCKLISSLPPFLLKSTGN